MLPFLPIKTDLAADSRLPDFLRVLKVVLKMWTRGLSYAPKKPTSQLFYLIYPKTGLPKWKAGSVRHSPFIFQAVLGCQ